MMEECGKVCIGQTGQPWLNTALTWDTEFNFTVPASLPLKPDT
jgi:hypothetical protein